MKSLFSTVQQTFLQDFIPTVREQGYKYYVAYSNYAEKEDSFGRYNPDLYIVFSKEKITTENGYSFTVPADSLFYSVRTNNYSSSSHANNSHRVTVQPFGGHLDIPIYEFVYTNSITSGIIQPDITRGEKSNAENYLQTSNFLLSALLVFTVLWSIFAHIK